MPTGLNRPTKDGLPAFPRNPAGRIFLVLLAALAGTTARSGPAGSGETGCAIDFKSREEGERVVVSGANRHPDMPYHVEVDFPVRENLKPSRQLPARFVISADAELDMMWLDRVDPRRSTRMKATYRCGMGDPDATWAREYPYIFPYSHGTKCLLSQGYGGAFTHQESFALDFQLPEGSPICAARPGKVVKVKQDSDIGGPGPEYRQAANHVLILHEDGTWACYSHLRRDSVRVEQGQSVEAGQVIALSGSTGQVSGPHLHFLVCKAQWGKDTEQSLPVKFLSLDGEVVVPEEGRFYYSVHPGGERFEPVLGDRIKDEDLAGHNVPVPRNGKVAVRADEIDHKIFLYCSNGTSVDQRVTLSLMQLRNLEPSKPLPFSRVVPAGREVFLLSLAGKFMPGRSDWDKSYEMQYSWLPADAGGSRQ